MATELRGERGREREDSPGKIWGAKKAARMALRWGKCRLHLHPLWVQRARCGGLQVAEGAWPRAPLLVARRDRGTHTRPFPGALLLTP